MQSPLNEPVAFFLFVLLMAANLVVIGAVCPIDGLPFSVMDLLPPAHLVLPALILTLFSAGLAYSIARSGPGFFATLLVGGLILAIGYAMQWLNSPYAFLAGVPALLIWSFGFLVGQGRISGWVEGLILVLTVVWLLGGGLLMLGEGLSIPYIQSAVQLLNAQIILDIRLWVGIAIGALLIVEAAVDAFRDPWPKANALPRPPEPGIGADGGLIAPVVGLIIWMIVRLINAVLFGVELLWKLVFRMGAFAGRFLQALWRNALHHFFRDLSLLEALVRPPATFLLLIAYLWLTQSSLGEITLYLASDWQWAWDATGHAAWWTLVFFVISAFVVVSILQIAGLSSQDGADK